MQKVIKNLGKNLDIMNVYSFFILNITAIGAMSANWRQNYKKNTANVRLILFFYNGMNIDI